MKAVKGNKVYIVDENSKDVYLNDGFDIVGDDGNLVETAKNKTVPYEEYQAVVKELEDIKSGQKSKK